MKHKKGKWDQIRAFIFTAIIFFPLLMFALSGITQEKLDATLDGNIVYRQPAEYSVEKWSSGEFQQEFEAWWNENYGLRAAMIKTYNQISYSLFKEGKCIIGKDGYIFEQEYIQCELAALSDYNCLLEHNRAAVEQYVETIGEVSRKLEQAGKKLIVYVSASKASACPQAIPDSEIAQIGDIRGLSPIAYFRELTADRPFTLLDTAELFDGQEEWPVFYKTGTHWSRPAEQVVTQALMEEIGNSTGLAVPQMVLGELNVSSKPYWRDADVFDLLNIWVGTTDDAYYEYSVSTVEPIGLYRPVNVLLQGSSFASGFQRDFQEYGLGGSIDYINYCTYVKNNTEPERGITSFDDVDLRAMMDRADVVIVEVNEAKILQRSDGFFDYLNAFLDSYVSEQPVTKSVDPRAKETVNTEAMYGFYDLEEKQVWAQPHSRVVLRDAAITERGLELHVTIPAEVADTENGQWRVHVNGVLKYAKPLAESGDTKVVIDVSDVASVDDTYEVQFLSDGWFVPAEISGGSDWRELSLAVHYIGAKR